ncbi:MAG: GDP-mannose 4,6-dehydratase, partial [Euryarchaeota archaeon]|nr:GDP-mannose 4,6-dehydratase [Euryarchaeota archaeon]
MTKSALITGITGQDGSYLAELLIEKGYRIYGMIRRLSTPNLSRIEHILEKIELIEGDLTDQSSINNALKEAQPTEVYNLAAQSFVATSWNQPVLTGDVTGLGTVRILEGVRHVCPDARFYQASSSEMFGKVNETPQNE